MSIHPTAIIESGAKIGANVTIGPYSYIGPNVSIGDGTHIRQHVTVEGCTKLGRDCQVFPQAVIGGAPQDLKFVGENTRLEIGDGNIFREMTTVNPGTAVGGGLTKIGSGNLFLMGVHIAHDCHIGNKCIFANWVQFGGHCHIEDSVNMGGMSAVHHFVSIGRNAFVAGMTRVNTDVPPFLMVAAARGNRTEPRMINRIGLQRSGFTQDDIDNLDRAYMRIFSRRARLSKTAIQERVTQVMEASTNGHVRHLCEFLLRSFECGRHGRYLEALRRDEVNRKTWRPYKADDFKDGAA